ncbi:MAG TPA: DUF3313 domain-containing protein [Hyphomicrobium sp.]|nr:DUF3313 domain-containing protein [Hyphomicrobium sp.]
MKSGNRIWTGCVLFTLLLTSCTAEPLTETGALSSYANLQASNGIFTRTRQRVDKDTVLAAHSVRLEPTHISPVAEHSGLTPAQVALVTNALDRALCSGLSRRFSVVDANQPADLTIHAVITHIGLTDVTSAGLSEGLSIGGAAVSATTGVPVPTPRLPFGLGALSVEAEATGAAHQSVAAMTWSRGADMLTTKTRLAQEADAYALAKEFAADFARFLLTGTDPMKASMPSLMTSAEITEFFGGKPKEAACEQFGPNPGLGDAIGGAIGLPPAWTDKGAETPR